MPWEELIWAFLKNAKARAHWANASLTEPDFVLREYRTLTLGGHRQSGKTQAAARTVMAQDGAYLMGGWVLGGHGRAREMALQDVPLDKTIEPHELVEAKLKHVKTIVIDPDSIAEGQGHDYYGRIRAAYHNNPEWFHPEFSVVRIINL